ncbi:hypothetical protein LINGRAPRIM_LOCUS684 [Linum grandiflorum]
MIFYGSSQSIQGIVRKFFQELALWNNHLVPVPSLVPSQGLNCATEANQRFNQQPNDQMSRSVHRRLLCDGSFCKGVQKAGITVICVNPEGHVVDGMAGRFFFRTPSVAEAKAVLAACILASREEGRCDVWSDCKEVVDACYPGIKDCPWEFAAVVVVVV